MYGTVARLRVKPGQEKALIANMKKWDSERGPKVKGYIASYLYRMDKDPSKMIMTVVFKDKASYFANANDPAQDKEYRELRKLLVATPQWNDGEIVDAAYGLPATWAEATAAAR